MGHVKIEEMFLETISFKTFETNSMFHVKYRTTGEV